MAKQKRTGGDRAIAISVCQTRATILARWEMGESLQDIATDLEMSYETVKKYAGLTQNFSESLFSMRRQRTLRVSPYGQAAPTRSVRFALTCPSWFVFPLLLRKS